VTIARMPGSQRKAILGSTASMAILALDSHPPSSRPPPREGTRIPRHGEASVLLGASTCHSFTCYDFAILAVGRRAVGMSLWAARVVIASMLALTTLLYPCTSNSRISRQISCNEYWSKSDLVVIARPVTKTTATDEKTYFDDIAAVHPGGTETKLRAVGVDTTFEIATVLKGHVANRRIVLHHLREVPDARGPVPVEVSPPWVVSFDPADKRYVQLVLVKERDGRYAPFGGQTDPGRQAVTYLPGQPCGYSPTRQVQPLPLPSSR
jgi:hypothetical protein